MLLGRRACRRRLILPGRLSGRQTRSADQQINGQCGIAARGIEASEPMSERVQIPGKTPAPHAQTLKPAPSAVLRRKCACGGSGGSGGDCADCKKKLQRRAAGQGPEMAPPIVHDVLRSPGQPLDGATRSYFEPRFRHDFSSVRVHTDARAAESAQAVNAHAYTLGHHVAFGTGQYSPSTPGGRRLLAHELAHVVQQGFRDRRNTDTTEIGPVGDPLEDSADRAAAALGESTGIGFHQEPYSGLAGSVPKIRRQPMTCATKKDVDTECGDATSKCQSAAGDCKSDFPNSGDLDAYIANLKTNFASSDFGPNAKRNFAHWLDGSGTELEMPSGVFEAHQATKDALANHRDKFVEGVKNRLADGRMKPGVVSDVIAFSGHANAFSFDSPHSDDLAFSVGGY